VNRHRVFALLVTILPATSQAGLSFNLTTGTDGKTVSVVRVWVDGDSSKTEYVEVNDDDAFIAPGSYFLANADGQFTVTPAQRTFSRTDSAMMEQMSAELMASTGFGGGGIEDVNVEKTIDEPGENIEGYATHHYRFEAAWKMSTGPVSIENETVEDVWIAGALDGGNIGSSPGATELPKEVRAAINALGANTAGLALRRITVASTKASMGAMGMGLAGLSGLGGRMAQRMASRGPGRRGRDDDAGDSGDSGNPTAGFGGINSTTTTTIEISGIEQVDIAADTFALPAGYRETQAFQTGPALPGLNDIEEEEEEDAQEVDVPSLNDLND
jgi:hypothetical protein